MRRLLLSSFSVFFLTASIEANFLLRKDDCDTTQGTWVNNTWNPTNCKLPTALEVREIFESYVIRSKICTLGTSLQYQQYRSLQRILHVARGNGSTRVEAGVTFPWSQKDFRWLVDFDRIRGSQSFGPSSSPSDLVNIDVSRAYKLRSRIKSSKCGTLILSAGHYFKKQRNRFHGVPGCPVTSGINETRYGCDYLSIYRAALITARRALENLPFRGPIIWMSFSPRHFYGGDWDSGGTCGSQLAEMVHMREEWEGYNRIAAEVWGNTSLQVRFFNISEMSWLRPDAHIGLVKKGSIKHGGNDASSDLYDCTHWLDFIPDAWNRILARVLSGALWNDPSMTG